MSLTNCPFSTRGEIRFHQQAVAEDSVTPKDSTRPFLDFVEAAIVEQFGADPKLQQQEVRYLPL